MRTPPPLQFQTPCCLPLLDCQCWQADCLAAGGGKQEAALAVAGQYCTGGTASPGLQSWVTYQDYESGSRP